MFVAQQPSIVLDFVKSLLRFRNLPPEAEEDVRVALARVAPESQNLFIWAAEDARLPGGTAMERLAAIWLLSAAVNLADDLADGDCDYLEPRVGPGVSFLLQALALLPLARAELSQRCLERCAVALTRAAAGQSLEVRGLVEDAERYLRVADLIAGEQYACYFGLLWEGSDIAPRAEQAGRKIGRVGLVLTDLASKDKRFLGLSVEQQALVLSTCRKSLQELIDLAPCRSIHRFADYATTILTSRSPELHSSG